MSPVSRIRRPWVESQGRSTTMIWMVSQTPSARTWTAASRCIPTATFRGADQIRTNWTAIFEGIPDISAHLIRSATNGDTVWAEWEWRGTRRDGQPHFMRGVSILVDAAILRMTSSVGGQR